MFSKFNRKRLLVASVFVVGVIAAGSWISLSTQPSVSIRKGDTELQASAPASVKQDYGKLPLSFEANQGQTDSQVKFLTRGSGYALFLTPNEAVLRLRNERSRERAPDSTDPSSAVLRMKLEGANANPQIAGLEELPGKSNYFIGNDPKRWRTDIPTYAKVKYAAVYPGVDLVYYSTQGRQLEYDFVVAAGADPRQIKLSFAGVNKLELDAKGDLLLNSTGRQMRMHKPVVYQEKDGKREEVTGRYTLNSEDEVCFDVAAYDAARPLVIDPVLVYSTFLGGSGQDTGVEVAVNSHGNAFVTGLTTSINFPTTNSSDLSGGSDAFVTKFSASGNQLIYSTYLGGSRNENYYPELGELGVVYGGIAIDSGDNAYITGLTRSPDFPVTANAPNPNLKGLSDAFVTKLNATGGTLLYSTFLGCLGINAADGGLGIAVDSLNQAYVTGLDYSGGLPVNGFATHSGGAVDGYIVKLNAAGSAVLYSTYFGGNDSNLGWGIAVDANQNAFVMGETVSTNFPTTLGAFDTTCGTDGQCNPDPVTGGRQADAFVIKVDTKFANLASLTYSTYLGGSKEERVPYNGSIAVNTAGDLIYVTGLTASVKPIDFPLKNAAQPLPSGSSDAFITKLDISSPLKSGLDQIVYSTYLGGPGTDFGAGIAADVNGNAYVAGSSGGTFPSTEGMSTCTDPGVVVAKLNAAGEIKYATCISGFGQDTGLDIAIDPAGCAYVTGFTESNNYPTVNAFQPLFAGGTGIAPSDGFVTKLCGGLDHFKCYDVRAEEAFLPFSVTLVDQFENEPVLIQRPVTLCNPVAKCIDNDHNPVTPPDCTQVLNPDDHLVCYETRDQSASPHFERRLVIVSNQFGQKQQLTVLRRTNLLCLPSLKANVEVQR